VVLKTIKETTALPLDKLGENAAAAPKRSRQKEQVKS
jgi:hypothetical protein